MGGQEAVDAFSDALGALPETITNGGGNQHLQALKKLADEQLDKLETLARRDAKIPDGHAAAALASLPGSAPLATLAFVDDELDARVLSWGIGPRKMAALLVETSEQQREAAQLKAPSMSKSGFRAFTCKDPGAGAARQRTDAEKEAQSLPMAFVVEPRGDGNPRYAVNVLTLADEGLRDTVFYATFGRTIITDTIADAQRIRDQCAGMNRNAPNIICRDGKKLTADGLLDPKDVLPAPQKQKFVFGTLPLDKDPRYVAIRRCQDEISSLQEVAER